MVVIEGGKLMEQKVKGKSIKIKDEKDKNAKMLKVKELLDKGKKNGSLTYKEIIEADDSIVDIMYKLYLSGVQPKRNLLPARTSVAGAPCQGLFCEFFIKFL